MDMFRPSEVNKKLADVKQTVEDLQFFANKLGSDLWIEDKTSVCFNVTIKEIPWEKAWTEQKD